MHRRLRSADIRPLTCIQNSQEYCTRMLFEYYTRRSFVNKSMLEIIIDAGAYLEGGRGGRPPIEFFWLRLSIA